jgi:hypothetical protein
MRNGIYRIKYESARGAGSGVSIFNNGRICGGDKTHYFAGTYSESGARFTAEVEARRHFRCCQTPTVPDLDVLHYVIEGVCSTDFVQASAQVSEVPGHDVKLTYRWLAQL